MDYSKMSLSAATAITAVGTPVTISRLGVVVAKTSGVFIKSEQSNAGGDPISGISMISTTTKTMLCPGTLKKKPEVGDDVFCKLGSFHINDIEEVNPAGVVLLYKIKMT